MILFEKYVFFYFWKIVIGRGKKEKIRTIKIFLFACLRQFDKMKRKNGNSLLWNLKNGERKKESGSIDNQDPCFHERSETKLSNYEQSKVTRETRLLV